MLCDDCQERPASVHVTKISNGQKKESHLCEICANNSEHMSFGVKPFGFFDLLNGLIAEGQGNSTLANSYVKPQRCKGCGSQYDQISKRGILGCSTCYETFGSNLEGLIKRIHGTTRHTGKIPSRAGQGLQAKRRIENLKAQLNTLVMKEAFEEAALVRDEIRSLEGHIGEGDRT